MTSDVLALNGQTSTPSSVLYFCDSRKCIFSVHQNCHCRSAFILSKSIQNRESRENIRKWLRIAQQKLLPVCLLFIVHHGEGWSHDNETEQSNKQKDKHPNKRTNKQTNKLINKQICINHECSHNTK